MHIPREGWNTDLAASFAEEKQAGTKQVRRVEQKADRERGRFKKGDDRLEVPVLDQIIQREVVVQGKNAQQMNLD